MSSSKLQVYFFTIKRPLELFVINFSSFFLSIPKANHLDGELSVYSQELQQSLEKESLFVNCEDAIDTVIGKASNACELDIPIL